ncbi:transglycosylase family protein [Pseudonocardia dioxanivorans]|uniref:transglycosylase family protein n=1 Tax=Pseudonocardia dioxanivorans TaxID=240495 RepID=UPI001F2EE66B|nr:transglycosylase family protein [Pseudonocardia dioxanivorans]
MSVSPVGTLALAAVIAAAPVVMPPVSVPVAPTSYSVCAQHIGDSVGRSGTLSQEQADALVDGLRLLLTDAALTSTSDARAARLVHDLRARGITPARSAVGWQQAAFDLADDLVRRAVAGDVDAGDVGVVLARHGFSPTPADLLDVLDIDEPDAGDPDTDDSRADDSRADDSRADRTETDSTETDRAGTDGAGTDRGAAAVRTATDRTGTDRTGTDRAGTVDRDEAARSDDGPLVLPAAAHTPRSDAADEDEHEADEASTESALATAIRTRAHGAGRAEGTARAAETNRADTVDRADETHQAGETDRADATDRADTDSCVTTTDWRRARDALVGTLRDAGDADATALADHLAHGAGNDAVVGTTASGNEDGRAPATDAGTTSAARGDWQQRTRDLVARLRAAADDPQARELADRLAAIEDSADLDPRATDHGRPTGNTGDDTTRDDNTWDDNTRDDNTRHGDTRGGATHDRADDTDDDAAADKTTDSATTDKAVRGGTDDAADSATDDARRQAPPDPSESTGAGSTQSDGVWDRLAQCESSGRWDIDTGNGYHGGLQFDAATWKAYGGDAYAPSADRATREQQIAVAEKVRDDRGGYSAWPACSTKLGL